jgi:hypothetical protein
MDRRFLLLLILPRRGLLLLLLLLRLLLRFLHFRLLGEEGKLHGHILPEAPHPLEARALFPLDDEEALLELTLALPRLLCDGRRRREVFGLLARPNVGKFIER